MIGALFVVASGGGELYDLDVFVVIVGDRREGRLACCRINLIILECVCILALIFMGLL